MTDIEVMDVLIAKLRAAQLRKPSGYRQDQLKHALAERARRSVIFSKTGGPQSTSASKQEPT